jgi:hypothetical protein
LVQFEASGNVPSTVHGGFSGNGAPVDGARVVVVVIAAHEPMTHKFFLGSKQVVAGQVYT